MASKRPGPVPSDASPQMKRYLQALDDSVPAIGERWRVIEGPYPHSDSPWCIQFQFRSGTAWKTVRAFKPDGTDA